MARLLNYAKQRWRSVLELTLFSATGICAAFYGTAPAMIAAFIAGMGCSLLNGEEKKDA